MRYYVMTFDAEIKFIGEFDCYDDAEESVQGEVNWLFSHETLADLVDQATGDMLTTKTVSKV